MGFGGLINSVNKTEGYDFRQGASESGLLVGAGAAGAKDNATSIAATGGYQSQTKIGSNEIVNTGNSGTITYGLSGADLIAGLSDVTGKIGDIVSKQTDASTGTINATLEGLSDLALSKQTDGESTRDNTILYVVAAVLALVAFIFWRK